MKASFLMAVAISVLWQSSGCDLEKPAPVAAAPQPPAVVAAPVKPFVMPTELEFSSLRMQKSSKFSISGDLRPFYLVSGRIHNNSSYTVTGVRFFVQIWTVEGKQDSAVLNLKTYILPDEVQTFDQETQLWPPLGKWNWQYEAMSVDAENY